MTKIEELRLSLVWYRVKPDEAKIPVPLGFLRALVAEHEPEMDLPTPDELKPLEKTQ